MSRDPDTPLILATGASHLLTHAYLLIYPALLLALQQEFGLRLLTLGVIANLHYLASGAGALPAGWIADRFGPARALRACVLGSAACLALVSLSPGAAALGAGFTLLGAFCSLHHPAGLALLSLGARRMSRALVLHGMIGNVGIALTPWLASAAAGRFGWRVSCVAFAIPGLLAGSIFPFLAPTRKLAATQQPRSQAPNAPLDPGPGREPRVVGGWAWGPLLLLYLTVTLTGLVYSGAMTFLPARLAAADPERLGIAGAVTSGALLVGMLGQYLGGLLWRRMAPAGLIALLLALSAPCLWLLGGDDPRLAALAAAGFAFFHFAAQPVSNGYLARWVPARRRSLGYGIYFTLSFGVGSFSAAVSGLVAERRGLAAVFPLLALVSVAAALAISATGLFGVRPSPAEAAPPYPS